MPATTPSAGIAEISAAEKAKRHEQAAETLDRQLDRSVYDDDPDVLERLEVRIAERTARRERMKAVNVWLRKNGGLQRGEPTRHSEDATWRAAGDALLACRTHFALTRGELAI